MAHIKLLLQGHDDRKNVRVMMMLRFRYTKLLSHEHVKDGVVHRSWEFADILRRGFSSTLLGECADASEPTQPVLSCAMQRVKAHVDLAVQHAASPCATMRLLTHNDVCVVVRSNAQRRMRSCAF